MAVIGGGFGTLVILESFQLSICGPVKPVFILVSLMNKYYLLKMFNDYVDFQ